MSMKVGVQNTLTVTLKEFTSSVTGIAPSLRFMRKIVPLIIHNIVYHRIELDENLFVTMNIKDWEYKTFKPREKHPLTLNIYHWARSIAEAIAKKQIRKIFLFFVNKTDKNSMEHFSFELKYGDGTPTKTVGGDALLTHTKKLFAVVNSLAQFQRLDPDSIDVIIEFAPVESITRPLNIAYFSKKPGALSITIPHLNSVPIGRLDSGYHQLFVKGGGMFGDSPVSNEVADNDDVVIVEEAPKDSTYNSQELTQNSLLLPTTEDYLESVNANRKKKKRSHSTSIEEENNNLEKNKNSPLNKKSRRNLNTTPDRNVTPIDNNEESEIIRPDTTISCYCTLQYSLDICDTLTCSICSRKMHIACAGYQYDASTPTFYICRDCGTMKKPATDVKLASVNRSDNFVALWATRLFLVYCIKQKRYPIELVDFLDPKITNKLNQHFVKISGLTRNADNTCTIEKTSKFTKIVSSLFYDVLDITNEAAGSMEI